ncbi:hypothetical protein FOG50_00380 [Hanseniaspora uvarum]|jgi:trafficking protein particle complex subunit 1|nr:hypothetical protein FOG50_00380 [Hanseniaspora uvarum]
MVKIYSFWIFDKHCNCIYAVEFDTDKKEIQRLTTNKSHMHEKAKLMYGLIFSMSRLTTTYYHKSIDHNDDDDLFPLTSDFKKISTGSYSIHTLKTNTGLIFSLVTDINEQDRMETELQYIYKEIYLKNITLNPFEYNDYALNENETRGEGFRHIENTNFDKDIYAFVEPLL